MPVNTESLNRKLFNVLARYKPKPLDVDGERADIEDVADVFKFTFSKDGKDYGDVYATIDDKHNLNLYYDDAVTECPSEPTPGLDYDDTWTGFIQFMKQWAFRNRLGWHPENNKDHLVRDMARRKYMKKQENISEGYYAMGKKASYSDAVPSVKIVIEHTRQIEEGEQRYRNVNRIFLENQAGERFLLDTKQPGIARVYARHIAEGGVPNDERWNHIKGLCEEYKKMAGFVRATRNGQFNESAQKLVESGIAHYQSLRESLSKMTGKRGYNTYFESWTPPLMEDDSDTSNLNELFVEESLDPRIESVMPILSKLQKKVSEMKEVDALAEWADSIDRPQGDANKTAEKVLSQFPMQLGEEESLTSNNPVGIPEGEDDLEEGIVDTIKKGVKKGLEKVGGGSDTDQLKRLQKNMGIPKSAQHGKPAMAKSKEQGVAEGFGLRGTGNPGMPTPYDQGRADAKKGRPYDNPYDQPGEEQEHRNYRKGYEQGKQQDVAEGSKWRNHPDAHEPDDSDELDRPLAIQPKGGYPNDELKGRPYSWAEKGKVTPDAAARKKASIKSSLGKHHKANLPEQGVAEDLDANQKRVGQLGPTEKVKNNNIGKLVGANENFINTVDQAVVTEEDLDEGLETETVKVAVGERPKGIGWSLKRAGKQHGEAHDVYTRKSKRVNEMDSEGYKGSRDDANEIGKGKESYGKAMKAKDVAKDAEKKLNKQFDKAHDDKKEVKEGQEEFDAMMRILKK